MKQNGIVLVTGASSGLGKDFALRLSSMGMTVYGVARRVEKLKELEQHGVNTMQMDITNPADITKVVSTIEKQHGAIDVLINNAGFGLYGPIEEVAIDKARYQFEVNLFGLAALTQQVIPAMRSAGSGKIINISSIGGKMSWPLGGWYHATKHALEGWSDSLRIELQSFGIDVVIIEPGLIDTEFGGAAVDQYAGQENSKHYSALTASLQQMREDRQNNRSAANASPPSVITDLVVHAIRARRPKTRYTAGFMAKPALFMRKMFSDRAFDKGTLRMIKKITQSNS